MSVAESPSTGKPYGLERVCRIWGFARSSFYAKRARCVESEGAVARVGVKRGPKPAVSDEGLLGLIKKDMDESPFHGEGHRKVWARLRFGGGIRVSRKRVLRIMRENHLLSPHRRPRGKPETHDGEIVTQAPNQMWGTDGARVLTAEDGYGWIFAAVEHWNAECVGWHVCKRGDRFAALQPVSMGVKEHFGSVGADAARGLSLRMDHGTQYLSDHFQNQIKFWGMSPSFGFLEQPQTNGVAERFLRTLKEQVIYGRVFRNLEEVRRAVARFVERYNRCWLVEKNGFLSPTQARQRYYQKEAA